MKQSNKGRYFLTLFPNGDYQLSKNSIKTIADGQGLNSAHISSCLNHPKEHHSHRGYKFIWMDRRYRYEKTANRHAPRYVAKLNKY